jgi:hypothetical protein
VRPCGSSGKDWAVSARAPASGSACALRLASLSPSASALYGGFLSRPPTLALPSSGFGACGCPGARRTAPSFPLRLSPPSARARSHTAPALPLRRAGKEHGAADALLKKKHRGQSQESLESPNNKEERPTHGAGLL